MRSSRSGDRRRAHPPARLRRRSWRAAAAAASAVANSAKQVAPEPDMRASRAPGSRAAPSAPRRPPARRRSRPGRDRCRARRGSRCSASSVAGTRAERRFAGCPCAAKALNTRASTRGTPGLTSTAGKPAAPAAPTGFRRCRASRARSRSRQTGTSAPTASAAAASRGIAGGNAVEPRQQPQRGAGIGGAAAEAGGDRQLLFQREAAA